MAFNLNKNNSTASKSDLNKKSNSQFDLSKKGDRETPDNNKKSSAKNWIIRIVGLLILGIGVWYFISKSNTSSQLGEKNSSTEAAENNPGNATISENVGIDKSASQITDSSIGNNVEKSNIESIDIKSALNNKITATFPKASTIPENIDEEIVKQIIGYLESNPNGTIILTGFASSEGDLSANQIISQSRADAFKNYLILKGVSANRIISNGKGIANPIASNDTEVGRQSNRRVEVLVN